MGNAIKKNTAPRLLEDVSYVQLQLNEKSDPSGRVRVKGEFARSGIATENKRVYPKKLWEREIDRLSKALTERRLFGELDHPTDGRTQLTRVSHIITGMDIKDGLVVGEAEIVPTERGKTLIELLKAGCKIGVSSRGYGSTKPNEQGEDVVQEDYKLVTFDFVAEPADTTAYPEVFSEGKVALFEGKEIDMDTDQEKAQEWARRLQSATQEGEEKARTNLKEEFARDILGQIGALKAEIREQVRRELLADPGVAAAKTAMEQVKEILRPFILPEDAEGLIRQKEAELVRSRNLIAERDLRIKELEEENGQLADLAKETGYRYYLEKTLAGDPDAEVIRSLIGDVKMYSSSGDLKAKVQAAKAEIDKKREELEAAAAEARRVAEEKDAADRAIREAQRAEAEANAKKISQLKEAAEKAVQANQVLALQLYIEKRLGKLGMKGTAVRALIEGQNPETKEDVDALFESALTEPARTTDDLDETRSRVRRITRGGSEGDVTEEETPRPSRRVAGGDSYNGLGVPLDELRKLAKLPG